MIRTCLVIAAFATIGLAVVFLRAEQARCAARIMAIESQWVSARREIWSVQARAARLRAPQQIHDRSIFLQSGVIPADESVVPSVPEHLVRSLPRSHYVGEGFP